VGRTTALHRRLAEIDENLIRFELKTLERAEWTKERKDIYLELHPETKRGVSGAHASNRKQGKGEQPTVPSDATRNARLARCVRASAVLRVRYRREDQQERSDRVTRTTATSGA